MLKGRTPNKKEREWMNRIVETGCCVCRIHMNIYTPCGIHHINGKTKPGAHFLTIPLCSAHHQTGGYGVALHAGKAEFERRYGTQEYLLEQTNKLLERAV